VPENGVIIESDASMSRIEKIEEEIRELSAQEIAALREWFIAFDADAWDQQIEADSRSGRLNSLAERALRDHAEGRTTKL
jgi:hypothetical protein